jgi:hypothetical protein
LSNSPPFTPKDSGKRSAGEATLSSSGKPKRQRVATAKALALLEEGVARRRKAPKGAKEGPQSPYSGAQSAKSSKSGSCKTLDERFDSPEICGSIVTKSCYEVHESQKTIVEALTPTPVPRSKPVLTTRVAATSSAVQSFNTIPAEESQYENIDDFQYHHWNVPSLSKPKQTRRSVATLVAKSPATLADAPLSKIVAQMEQQIPPKDVEIISISSSPTYSPPPGLLGRPTHIASPIASVSSESKDTHEILSTTQAFSGLASKNINDDYTLALARVRGSK